MINLTNIHVKILELQNRLWWAWWCFCSKRDITIAPNGDIIFKYSEKEAKKIVKIDFSMLGSEEDKQ